MDDPLRGGRDPMVIDARPDTMRGRLSAWLRARRVGLALILALAEVVAFLVWRPSALLMATLATLVLVGAAMLALRLRPGVGRDLLWIVAIAQAMVVVVPLVLGLSLLLGLVVAAVVLVALVVLAARGRG